MSIASGSDSRCPTCWTL